MLYHEAASSAQRVNIPCHYRLFHCVIRDTPPIDDDASHIIARAAFYFSSIEMTRRFLDARFLSTAAITLYCWARAACRRL